MHVAIYHHLGRIGVGQSLKSVLRREGLHQSGYLSALIQETVLHTIELGLLYEGFVTLYVHHHISVCPYTLTGLPAAVSTTAQGGVGHHGLASKSLHCREDALIVGADIHFIKSQASLLIYTLYYRFATEHGKGLAGKARTGITRWYKCQEFHCFFVFSITVV